MMDKTEAARIVGEAIASLGKEGVKEMLAQQSGATTEVRVRASDPVRLYAQKDVPGGVGISTEAWNAMSPAQKATYVQVGDKMHVIVHPRGHMQEVPPADVLEIMRLSPGNYDTTPPPAHAAPQQLTELPGFGGTGTADAQPGHGADTKSPAKPDPALFQLTSLPNVNEKLARSMEDAGFGTLRNVQVATIDGLAAVPGMGTKLAERIVTYVAENYPKGA